MACRLQRLHSSLGPLLDPDVREEPPFVVVNGEQARDAASDIKQSRLISVPWVTGVKTLTYFQCQNSQTVSKYGANLKQSLFSFNSLFFLTLCCFVFLHNVNDLETTAPALAT